MEHETAPAADGMAVFWSDPATWAGVGLIIFLGIVFFVVKAHKSILKSLDDRAAKITSELAAAEALRIEAEKKLADAQKRATESEAEAKEIVAAARREAQQLASAATVALQDKLVLREKQATERIARAEADAVRDVRVAAIDAASRAAAVILTEQLTGKTADDHFAASLETVKKALA